MATIIWWPTAEPIDSVAVVKFKNLSDDRERFQYFVDGFSEELAGSLSRAPDLKIAVGPADIGEKSASEIARILGVDAIVTGSVRTDGDKVRITAALISRNGIQL